MKLETLIKARYLLPYALRMALGAAQGNVLSISVNLTDRCQLKCPKCYWWETPRIGEISDEQLVAFLIQKKEAGVLHCTFVGGEPMLNPRRVKLATGIFGSNWLVTNGDIPFVERFDRTTVIVSIDGVEKTHNLLRPRVNLENNKNVYQSILRNLGEARSKWPGRFPVFIHTTLGPENYEEIEAILETWLKNRLADGVMFSLVATVEGADNKNDCLNAAQGIWVVNELLTQKKVFKGFLINTTRMIRQFHPDHTRSQTPETCPTALHVHSFDAQGKRIPKCIMEKADCAGCGCVVTPLANELSSMPNLETLSMALKIYTVGPC
jgi:sulfatase maturation enzyme AslB (radical SAM superfamily)